MDNNEIECSYCKHFEWCKGMECGPENDYAMFEEIDFSESYDDED